MSYEEQDHFGRNAALAAAGVIGALGIGGHELAKAVGPLPDQQAKTELKAFNNAIVSGEAQNVLENGTADVTLESKGKYAHLVNPVVTEHGHVIGRDKYTGKVIVYYKDSGTDGSSVAKKITWTKDGKHITQKEAIADSKPLVLETPQKVGGSDEFAYVAAKGQGFDNQPIGVDSPQKTITVEEVVPDKG